MYSLLNFHNVWKIQYDIYFYNIYITLALINSLQIISNIWEDVCRFYANMILFFVRSLNIFKLGNSLEFLEPKPWKENYFICFLLYEQVWNADVISSCFLSCQLKYLNRWLQEGKIYFKSGFHRTGRLV